MNNGNNNISEKLIQGFTGIFKNNEQGTQGVAEQSLFRTHKLLAMETPFSDFIRGDVLPDEDLSGDGLNVAFCKALDRLIDSDLVG
ncbi:MAG: hypothetical protein PHH70_00500 [Candidatus Gracilibacteria bacterium]|nr:hypothetical protein [Candidatus Gracilibacteria bacterium]